MSTLTNLTDEAVWEAENDDYNYEDKDFTHYVPTSFQPGWNFTYMIIFISLGIKALLPLFLCLENRRKKAKGATGMEIHALTPSDFGREMQDQSKRSKSLDEDDKSLGGMSVASNAFSVVSSVLDQRVSKSTYHRQKHRKRRGRRVINSRDVDVNYDMKSLASGDSVMGTLEADAISVNDAVDARQINVNKMGAVNEDPDRELSWIERLVDCSTWDEEMKKIVSLWVPYFISGAATGVSEIISFAIISHYIGLKEANAYVTVIILMETTDVFLYGFVEAVGILGPQADGACNDLLLGRYLQLGLVFYTLLCIPSIIIWGLYTAPAVMWFGFDEETAQLAQAFAYPMLVSGILEGADEMLGSFLDFMNHEQFAMYTTILGEVVDVGIFVVMASMGIKDLVLIGIIQSLVSFLEMITIISVVLYWGWLDDYWEGIALTWGWNDKQAVSTMVKTAIPLGFSYLLTYGEWEVMILLAAHMGPAEVTAWGVLAFVWDTFEYVVDGLSDAVEVRVGFRMGAGEMMLAKNSAYKGMYLAVVISVYGTAGLFLMSGHLPGWLTPDPTIQHMIFETLPLIGFGQILMSVGMVSWNIVGAQGPQRVRLACIVEFISSWVLVVPFAAVLVYGCNYNLMGLVGPLVVGYTAGCVAIIFILVTSDWGKLTDQIVEMNGGNISYDEYEWEDLPVKIQESAILLGYTAEIWDSDDEPASSSKDWKGLTKEEQDAARRLGFNRKKWDNDASGGTDERSTSTGYDDYDWEELPFMIQQAARVLGYTSSIWDANGEPSSSEKGWTELNSEEQEAAIKLGYDQRKWDDNGDSISPTRMEYDDMDWKELPSEIQNAAKVLGYTKAMWDNDREPKTSERNWKKLTIDEKNAAKKLGYNYKSWDDKRKRDENGDSISPTTMTYDGMDWKELPSEIQNAAKVLGYTKAMWDDDLEPKTSEKDWNKLTIDEMNAAKKLGYNQKSWNGNGKSESQSQNKSAAKAPSDPATRFDDLDWEKLPSNIQEAARVLGYTGRKWDTDDEPLVFYTHWKDLTPEIQTAAKEIGYSKAKWDIDVERKGPINYLEYKWSKLPPKVQNAAPVLGYTPKMWNNKKDPELRWKSWRELSPEQRLAAEVIGFNQAEWSKDSLPEYDEYSWRKLPPKVQEAAMFLGYTANMWDNDQDPELCKENDYDDLTSEQKAAAFLLGYDKNKWDKD